MKKSVTIALQVVVVAIGAGALGFLLWEPNVEGRNAHATLFEVYFKDPFLAYVYAASVPFFAVLVQAFKLLRYARQDKTPSTAALRAVRTIKFCAASLIGLVVVGEIFIALNDSDDRAGGVFMGLLITLGSVATAAAAARLERKMKNCSSAR